MASAGAERQEVLDLMRIKDKIEAEIKELTQILNQNRVGMVEPLVDKEGFPRDDIDVAQVCRARHQIIYLQNDHKAVMKQIEDGLAAYYGTTNSSKQSTSSLAASFASSSTESRQKEYGAAIAQIMIIEPDSPMDLAGFKNGDLILEWGSINASNYDSIWRILTVIRDSVGQKVDVVVARRGLSRPIMLQVVPHRWTSRHSGLLGCQFKNIQEYSTDEER